MIYYKKKSLIKKILRNIKTKTQEKKSGALHFFKIIFSLIFLLFIILYASYLYLIPNYINEENAKKIIDNFILKNSNLYLDIKDINLKPDYRLNLNIKASNATLKYPNKKVFITVENPNININLLPLIYGNIDLSKIKADKITLNTTFTKENSYECFKFFNTNKQKTKFKIKNINLNTNNLLISLFDENINKSFYLKSSNFKISTNQYLKTLNINSTGKITDLNHKYSDYILKLAIKLNQNSTGEFKEKLAKLNYNPLVYANKYNFYSNTEINLKINPNNKKTNFEGYINLKDFLFSINNIKLPKNNMLLKFKADKIYSNCNFKLFNNQEIKINSTASISKNKFIEAKFNSGKINLEDLNNVFSAISEIFNLKFNLKEITTTGTINADLYLKSNFKTLNSSGKLSIENGEIYHKKTGLKLTKINSDINLENNKINITHANAFINEAKFNLSGTIDNKTNLDIKINSEPINIAQITALIKDLPFLSHISNTLNNYIFDKGFLKINTTINGNLQSPIIKTNSTIENLKLNASKNDYTISIDNILITANPQKNLFNEFFIDASNINFAIQKKSGAIPKLKFKIINNNIIIPKTSVIFEKNPLKIEGEIKNYNNNQNDAHFKLEGQLPQNNPYFTIQKNKLYFNSLINLKQNNLNITSFNISDGQNTIATVSGSVFDFAKNATLNDIKIILNEKINLYFPKYKKIKTSIIGNLILNGNILKPNVSGKLNLQNILSDEINLDIKNATLNINDSKINIQTDNGNIFDFDFNLLAQAEYKNNKFIFNNIELYSPYINLESFEKYLTTNKENNNFKFEINNIKANIQTIETSDIILNSATLNGELKENILNINSFNAEIFNGKIEGKSKINLTDKKIKTEIILKELNIRQLSNKLKELSIAASGKLSALINAEFYEFNMENIIKTFDGYIKFNIDNGELSQFAKLERFLQAGNILSQGFLKLTLNSTLSALTKQNTGDFKTIEGTLKIKDSIANIQYINTQGSNMSLHITGKYNLLTNYVNTEILGRIPNSIVNVMGSFGNFSLSKLDKKDRTDIDTKFSIEIPKTDIDKIPPLAYNEDLTNTKEFIVIIDGLTTSLNSIKDFKWNLK